jgi:formate-dependent phosphoribosylglycinamide formyltransferase (GAR transformylase)
MDFQPCPFARVDTLTALRDAVERIGRPVVVKTAAFGYDGKGQRKVGSPAEIGQVWEAIGAREVVVEKFINLQAEISVIAARGLDGSIAEYVPFENRHSRHILDVTTAPAMVAPPIADRARAIAREILEKLQYVGVLCVEFFVSTESELFVNELAPRPHNSGHLTVDAAVTSQFEQQVRAITGPASGIGGAAAACGNGQHPRRPVGGRRTELGRRMRVSRREAAPLRQGGSAPRKKDGPPHGDGPHGRRSTRPRHRRARRVALVAPHTHNEPRRHRGTECL